MHEFSCGTRIFSGPGALAALKELGAKRLMLVADPFFVKNGRAEAIARSAGAEAYEIFDGVQPDPSVLLAAEGAAKVRQFRPDMIVALGGGSAMDCAKAMAFFGGCGRLVAIPTTSGSGSEVTDFAVLTHEGSKFPLVDPRLQPEAAILDGALLKELPPSLIADCGFDVLAHALEAWVGTKADPITDALARDAFTTVFTTLYASFTGDLQPREGIHLASTMAGMAFNRAGLGLCHSLSHALGARFHIPHGRLNAIILPAVVERNAAAAGEKYAALARFAGLGGSARTMGVRNLKNGLIRLRQAVKLPGSLAQAGADPREIRRLTEEIIKAVLADPCTATNPLPVDGACVAELLEAVTGHG